MANKDKKKDKKKEKKGGGGKLSFLTPEEKQTYKEIEKRQGAMAAEQFAKGVAQKQGKDYVVDYGTKGSKTATDFHTAGDIADSTGITAPLGRVSEEDSPEMAEYLKQLNSRSDPTSAGYAGKRSDEAAAGIQRLDSQVGTSPEMTAALEALKAATERTEETSKILKTMEGGLAGLNAEENTAIREAAQRQAMSALKTAQSNVEQVAARTGARGFSKSANLAEVNRQFGQDRLAAEQDLLIKNIDIQDKRRKDYADTLNQVETREQGRRNDYTDALGTEEDARFGRSNDYLTALRGLEEDEHTRTTDAQDLYGRVLGDRDDRNAKAEGFNVLQGNTEQAARAAAIAGIADYQNTKTMGKKQMNLMKQQVSGSGRSGGGDSGANAARDEYLAALNEAERRERETLNG